MKKLSLVMVAMAMIFTSCEKVTGEGPIVTQTRNVQDFTGVDLRSSANVYFKQDPNFKVEVSAQQNVLDVLEVYVSNNRLVVRFKNDVRVKSHEPVSVIVHAPSVSTFRVSGSGMIQTTSTIQTPLLNMDISGSGDIKITELLAANVDANISGSGSINVDAGTAQELDLKISGSGRHNFSNLQSTSATTNTSGSGDIRLHATQQLQIKISGSGSVYYKGTPVISTNISGSGKVRPI